MFFIAKTLGGEGSSEQQISKIDGEFIEKSVVDFAVIFSMLSVNLLVKIIWKSDGGNLCLQIHW